MCSHKFIRNLDGSTLCARCGFAPPKQPLTFLCATIHAEVNDAERNLLRARVVPIEVQRVREGLGRIRELVERVEMEYGQ